MDKQAKALDDKAKRHERQACLVMRRKRAFCRED